MNRKFNSLKEVSDCAHGLIRDKSEKELKVEKSVQIDPCRRKKIDPLVKIRLVQPSAIAY